MSPDDKEKKRFHNWVKAILLLGNAFQTKKWRGNLLKVGNLDV